MNSERESENSMRGIFNPPPSSYLNHQHHNRLVRSSSMSRASKQTQYSPSNPFSNGHGFDFSDDAGSYSTPFEESKYPRRSTTTGYSRELLSNPDASYSQTKEKLLNDLGLSESFCRMHISSEEGIRNRGFDRDPDGIVLGNASFGGAAIPCNDPFGFEAFRSSKSAVPISSDGDKRFKPGSPLTHIHSTSRSFGPTPSFNGNPMIHMMGQTQEQNVDALLQPHGNDSNRGKNLTDSFSSTSRFLEPKLKENMRNSLYNTLMMEEWTKAKPRGEIPQVFRREQCAGEFKGFIFEDSFIIEGKCLSGNKVSSSKDSQLHFPAVLSSLDKLKDYIYCIAKDQYGCRTLQTLFEQGTSRDVQIIFDGVIDHVVELSINPFGNYLIQKLLDVCCKQQKLQIAVVLTQKPGQLVDISLDAHGSRVVQKLIENAEDRDLIELIMSAIEPGFLLLAKDLNGNHVVQRCLQCFSSEHNEHIFHDAVKYCIDIATHRQGCCVLQRCLSRAPEKHLDKLVTEITNNALFLAQDPYGNYVIQFIIGLRLPSANAKLASQFRGNYEYLSMHKFSSHVVEKCLKHFDEIRPSIIYELLSVSQFDQLLEHPFANYDMGALHESILSAVQPYVLLQTRPFCKKIFSRSPLKK
ncbi:hypothetical protein G4B88_002732 [Cannabis sativa]|uniref:PUM-HD domain-containing protein n=1 Tax=Cannabis sativa TaxID=3483 RepID=A0A7J6HIJ6_CANSA|nr:hypothetical protein G4B88_002732 [Cannabis sativa]